MLTRTHLYIIIPVHLCLSCVHLHCHSCLIGTGMHSFPCNVAPCPTETKADRQAKWDMFYEGTLLSQIESLLKEAEAQLQESQEVWKVALTSLKQLDKLLQERTEVLERLKAVQG